jgi:D-glycerate 3-kinase
MMRMMHHQFQEHVRALGLPSEVNGSLDTIYRPVAEWISKQVNTRSRMFCLGISGAQGSGKSTFCELLSFWLQTHHQLKTAVLSIDDLYLTRSERHQLSQAVHPLCAFRGVPGTHDVDLGHRIIDELTRAGPDGKTPIPRFDKTRDDRRPASEWESIGGPTDVLLFEGWCIGAKPLGPWTGPINQREAEDDPDGEWATWSNRELQQKYGKLFDRLDGLVMLKVPSMETVRKGRWKQEQRAWANLSDSDVTRPGLMTESEVHHYVALFERLTRSMLREMPTYADAIIEQDDNYGQQLVKIPSD